MKTLKKVLALTLALAMAFTMMAGAAFTDASDIDATKAVNTLSALNVIKGKSNGSFDPNGNVTRGEMAKMIFTIKNGGNDDASYYAGLSTTFTDINGHWAQGYIKYAASLGIINGRSATKFDPNASVTGLEAAKMALVLMGYKSDKAGLVGASWGLKTAALASENGLFDDVSGSVTSALSRQYAAQLLYNTVYADTYKWSNDNIEFDKQSDTVGEKYMDLVEYEGIFNGNDKMNTSLKDGECLVGDKRATYTIDNELIGEEVKVLYKNKGTGTDLDSEDDVYGITPTGDTTVYKITKGDLQTTSETSKIKFNDKEYDVEALAADKEIIVNNLGASATKNDATPTSAEATTAFKALKADSADKIKFVTNDEGKIVKAYVTASKFAKVSAINSTQVSLSNSVGTIKFEDNNIVSGLAKDDIVKVVTYFNTSATNSDAYSVVTKADIVTAKVQAVKGPTEVKVDGNFVKVIASAVTVGDYNEVTFTNSDLDESFDFIMSEGYIIAAKQVSESSKDYAIILENTAGTAGSLDSLKVKLLLADGTEKTYDVDDDSDAALKTGTSNSLADTLVAYAIQNDGTVKLTATTPATDKGEFDTDIDKVTLSGSSYLTDASAVAFVKVDTDWYAYKANTMKDVVGKDTTLAQYKLDDSKVVVFALVSNSTSKPGNTVSSAKYAYVIDSSYTVKEGDDTYTMIKAWDGANEVTIKVENDVRSEAYAQDGAFIKYEEGTNGITQTSDISTTGTAAKVNEYYADRQILDIVGGPLAVADDLKIIGVDAEDTDKAVLTDISAYDEVKNTNNIMYVLDDDSKVCVVFIDIDNDINPVV